MSTVGAPKKILVVDDNEIVIKTISLKLQGAGYQVLTAMDGSAAVATARKESPDLILLDLSFPPDVDGVAWDGFRIMDGVCSGTQFHKTGSIMISGRWPIRRAAPRHRVATDLCRLVIVRRGFLFTRIKMRHRRSHKGDGPSHVPPRIN